MRTSARIGSAIPCSGLLAATSALAVVIDFTGGTATLSRGATFVPNRSGCMSHVRPDLEDGIRVTFNGAPGIIGGRYSIRAGGFVGNDVIHAHWDESITSITFEKVHGNTFDLTCFDLSANTIVGGGQSHGTGLSHITASNGTKLKLPSSNWGFSKDFFGQPGDGISRLDPDASFLGISSFTVTSENAYCFGLDNFCIDEAAPAVPEPENCAMLSAGLAGITLATRRYQAGARRHAGTTPERPRRPRCAPAWGWRLVEVDKQNPPAQSG